MSSKSIAVRIGVAALVITAAAACGSSNDVTAPSPSPVVTSVVATIAPGQSGTGGPFVFTGTIAATGATPVNYRWELSTGELQDVQVMQFGGAGSLTSNYTFKPPLICIGANQQLWARLTVLTPNVIESEKVSFTRRCLILQPHL